MGEVLLWALATALNPTLLAVTTVLLLLPNAERLMLSYWAGAMLCSISLGLVIVFALNDSGVVHTTKRTLSPLGDFLLAGIMLSCAVVLARGGRHEQVLAPTKRARGDQPPRWERALDRGASVTLTFVMGVLLSLPGFTYLVGLDAITKLHYPDVVTVVVVICFNLVQFVLIEVPIIGLQDGTRSDPGSRRAGQGLGAHACPQLRSPRAACAWRSARDQGCHRHRLTNPVARSPGDHTGC
jgi:hypothetical protein